MFWGCISWAGTGPLIAVEGSLRGSDYADILWQCIPQVKDNLGIQSAYIIEDHPKVHQTLEVLGTKEDLRLKGLRCKFGYKLGTGTNRVQYYIGYKEGTVLNWVQLGTKWIWVQIGYNFLRAEFRQNF